MWLTCLSSPYVLFAAQSTIVLSWIDFPPLVQSSDARHLPSFIIIDSCVTLIYDPNHLNFLMIYTYFKIILNKNYGHFPAKFYNRIFGTFIQATRGHGWPSASHGHGWLGLHTYIPTYVCTYYYLTNFNVHF